MFNIWPTDSSLITRKRAHDTLFVLFLSIFLPVCLPACLSVSLSACLPAWLPVYLSACLSVCLSACLPTCLSVCLPHNSQNEAIRSSHAEAEQTKTKKQYTSTHTTLNGSYNPFESIEINYVDHLKASKGLYRYFKSPERVSIDFSNAFKGTI